jgi:hypothetical protein
MMGGRSIRDQQDHANHQARKAALAARRRRVADLWPVMSINDIAIALDVTTGAIVSDGLALDLPSRPLSVAPGQSRARYTPPQNRRRA